MRYVYNRVIAYFIDMLIVVVLATVLSKVSFINPQIDNYNKYSNLYGDHNLNYQSFVGDLQKYYSDNKISEKEYDKLIDKYDDMCDSVKKYYGDSKITRKEYDKIINDANKDFIKKNKKLYYNVSKYSVVYNVIMVVLLGLYFIVFNVVTDGQTLGKKLVGLKIVNKDGGSVSVGSYILRFIILYGPLYYIILIIGSMLMSVNNFYSLALVVSNIKNYLSVAIFVFILYRSDNRGLHDFVAGTRVIDLKYKEKEKLDGLNGTKKKNKGKKIIVDSEEN